MRLFLTVMLCSGILMACETRDKQTPKPSDQVEISEWRAYGGENAAKYSPLASGIAIRCGAKEPTSSVDSARRCTANTHD